MSCESINFSFSLVLCVVQHDRLRKFAPPFFRQNLESKVLIDVGSPFLPRLVPVTSILLRESLYKNGVDDMLPVKPNQAMFTLYRMAFALVQKPYRVGSVSHFGPLNRYSERSRIE